MHALAIDHGKLDSFLARAVGDLSAGYGGVMVGLGHKLGLYKATFGAGPQSGIHALRRAAETPFNLVLEARR